MNLTEGGTWEDLGGGKGVSFHNPQEGLATLFYPSTIKEAQLGLQ